MFYGDIFRVGDFGCLIFGSGKTKAFREVGVDVSLDFACLVRVEDTLYSSFGLPTGAASVIDTSEGIKIDYMFNCLTEYSMDFNDISSLCIKEITYDDFVALSEGNIRCGNTMENFILLTHGCKIRKFLTVPWMPEFDDKVQLIKDYFAALM